MKIVNRGYLKITPLQPFIEWANLNDDEIFIDGEVEGNVYLIEEDFFDVEPIIERNFKKIFVNELEAISEDEGCYPPITQSNFEQWFSVSVGNSVFDCEKGGIQAD